MRASFPLQHCCKSALINMQTRTHTHTHTTPGASTRRRIYLAKQQQHQQKTRERVSNKQGAERGMGAGGIIGAKLKPGKKEANERATTQTAGQLNSFLLYPLRAIPFPVSGKPRPVAFASSDITMQRTHTHTRSGCILL